MGFTPPSANSYSYRMLYRPDFATASAWRVVYDHGQSFFDTSNPYAAMSAYGYLTDESKLKLSSVSGFLNLPQLIARSSVRGTDYNPPMPSGLEMHPFQRAGVEFAISRRNSLIGDEMGLGKTIQAIGIDNAVGRGRVLVICPAGLRLNWAREITKWSLRPNRIETILKGGQKINKDAEWLCISYELATRMADELIEFAPHFVVLDEVHKLKNPTTKRTRAILGKRGVVAGAERVVSLTGTPIPNNPSELWPLLNSQCPQAIEGINFADFRTYFAPQKQIMISGRKNTGQSYTHAVMKDAPPRNLEELQMRLRAFYMIRRLKKDVLTQLPEKQFQITLLEEDAKIRAFQKRASMLNMTLADLRLPENQGIVNQTRQELGVAKVPAVVNYAHLVLHEEDKVLIGFYHRAVGEQLLRDLSAYDPVMIYGATSMANRAAAVKEFQEGKARVFLGQIKAAGEGITLTAARRVLIAEPSWTPGDNDQFADRPHRIGQKENVLVDFLLVDSLWDSRVIEADQTKRQYIHLALDKII